VATDNALIADLVAAGVSKTAALHLIGLSKSTAHYRTHPRPKATNPTPHTKRGRFQRLSAAEVDEIGRVLDAHPHHGVDAVFYLLLNQGTYRASLSSWYRIARRTGRLMKQRWGTRHTPRRLNREQPQLTTTAPGEVICWDVTWLAGEFRGVNYPAYLFIDLYSRKIVAACVAYREKAALAAQLIDQIARTVPQLVTLHADNGAMMTSHTVAEVCQAHNITTSYIRPSVSNDNAYIESLNGTLKTRTDYPGVFDDLDQAQQWLAEFVTRYNATPHTGIKGYTPNDVWDNTWSHTLTARTSALETYYAAHPERQRRTRTGVTGPPAQASLNTTSTGQTHKRVTPTHALLVS